MPDITQELHAWRIQWIVFGELEFCGEDSAFERGAFGTLDQSFPEEYVVFRYRAGGDAIGRGGREGAVFVEEAAGGEGGCHV